MRGDAALEHGRPCGALISCPSSTPSSDGWSGSSKRKFADAVPKIEALNAAERACPCCGIERKEIGTDESWQVEYVP